MKITVTPEMLCTLCAPYFTLEACEAICNYFEECAPEAAPMIGDIAISFSEIHKNDVEEEDEKMIIAELDNGNVVIAN